MRLSGFLFLVPVWLCAGGCAFGPRALEQTHGRYNEAYRHVDSEELLINIVRLRYGESPAEVEVASITSQYELSAQLEARPFFEAPNPAGSTFRTFANVLPFVGAGGASRPTISMTPTHAGATIARYMKPITLEGVALFADTSWPISTIFRMWLEGANGVPNAPSASGPTRGFAPEFAEFQQVCRILQQLQDQGELTFRTADEEVPGDPIPTEKVTGDSLVEAQKAGLEYRRTPDGKAWQLFRKTRKLYLDLSPRALVSPEYLELVRLLNLKPGLTRYEVTQSTVGFIEQKPDAKPSDKIVLVPRSLIQVLYYVSHGVEVPATHLGTVAKATFEPDGSPFDWRQVTDGLFTVKSSCGRKPPCNALVSVRYRGHWFYIEDTDHATKSAFILIRPARQLDVGAVGVEKKTGPMLTLPVGR